MTLSNRFTGALLAALLAPAIAFAHDTWLNPPMEEGGSLLTLTLASGNRFPKQESTLAADGVMASGCFDGQGRSHELRARGVQQDALRLRVRAEREPVLSCWVQTRVFEVQIEPALVDVYLKEIQAPAPALQAWQAQRVAGIAWQEAYAKNARIELAGSGAAAALLNAARKPLGRGLEIVPAEGHAPRTGADFVLQVLLDGRPLPGQAVELVSERNPLGVWRRSDAQGRLQYPIPFAGRWLLRATHLVPPAGGDKRWRSQFATLAIQVP